MFAGGLSRSSRPRPSTTRGDAPIVTDGPFAESKEYLGGFWVIEAADLDAALEWAQGGLGGLRAARSRCGRSRASMTAGRDRPRRRSSGSSATEYGRVVASLIRRFGDIDVAEEAAGEALLAALERWPVDGVPPNPGGWLTTTAGNRAIDRIRRESHARRQAPGGPDDLRRHTPRADRRRSRTTGSG